MGKKGSLGKRQTFYFYFFLKLALASFWLQTSLQKVEVKASHFKNTQRSGLIFLKLLLSVVILLLSSTQIISADLKPYFSTNAFMYA